MYETEGVQSQQSGHTNAYLNGLWYIFKCDFPLAHFSTQGTCIIPIHYNIDYHTLDFRYFIRIFDLHCMACYQNVGTNWFKIYQCCC